MKLDKSQEICKIIKTKSNGSIIGTTTFYFEKQQNLKDGLVKGLLTIHDPNYFLHGQRVNRSPYSELSKSAFLQNLVCSTEYKFLPQTDKVKSEANANALISSFLEKMKPVEIEN